MQNNTTDTLRRLAEAISLSGTLEEAEDIYVAYEAEADKCVSSGDYDIGAMMLAESSWIALIKIRKMMLSKALERATWFAACATSGAEGQARSRHVCELSRALRKSSVKTKIKTVAPVMACLRG